MKMRAVLGLDAECLNRYKQYVHTVDVAFYLIARLIDGQRIAACPRSFLLIARACVCVWAHRRARAAGASRSHACATFRHAAAILQAAAARGCDPAGCCSARLRCGGQQGARNEGAPLMPMSRYSRAAARHARVCVWPRDNRRRVSCDTQSERPTMCNAPPGPQPGVFSLCNHFCSSSLLRI